jgi:hypothetical protein
LQLKFFLVQRGNQRLDQGNALPRFLRATHEQAVLTMRLELRRFLTECAANAFTELQFCSGLRCIKVGKTFSAKILHL